MTAAPCLPGCAVSGGDTRSSQVILNSGSSGRSGMTSYTSSAAVSAMRIAERRRTRSPRSSGGGHGGCPCSERGRGRLTSLACQSLSVSHSVSAHTVHRVASQSLSGRNSLRQTRNGPTRLRRHSAARLVHRSMTLLFRQALYRHPSLSQHAAHAHRDSAAAAQGPRNARQAAMRGEWHRVSEPDRKETADARDRRPRSRSAASANALPPQ